MTQSPFEPPNDPRLSETRTPARRDDPPVTGPQRPLTFDEMVALLVAFLSLGSVLFWGLTRGNMNLLGNTAASGGSSGAAISEASPAPSVALGGGSEADSEPAAGSGAVGLVPGTEADEGEARSARRELAERAARDRADSPRRIWDNVRAGVASAAAGIAGVAVTADEAPAAGDATGEDVTGETDIAAGSADTPAATADGEGGAVPPETAPSATAPSEAATATPQAAIEFSDVPDNYWAKPYIDALSSRGLIAGFSDATFKPDQPVTRSQVANIVSRTFDLTADKEDLEFPDVAGDYWARESIGEVVRGGFMTGFPDDTFKPDIPVTRAQALTTLVTGLSVEAPTNVQAALSRYTDANAIPNWANEKMAAATAGSLVVNYPNLEQLNPAESTTRAELSAMIYQALVREGVVDPIESDYVVKP